MNANYISRNLQEIHGSSMYEDLEVADEQVIYCHSEYDDDSSSMYHVEEVGKQNVSCHVIGDNIFSPESIDAANQDHSTCFYCKEDLRNKRFYVHLFDHHGFTKQQCEIMKQQKRLETKGKNISRKSLHSCMECGMEFVTRTGLNNHLSKKDNPCAQIIEPRGSTSAISNIVCPGYGCSGQFSTYLDLAVHVDSFHRDLVSPAESFMIRRKTFADKKHFVDWKKTMESETNSEFFLRSSQKVTFAIRTTLYKCLCSNSRGQIKRKCEQCPAFIKACQRNHGQYEVVACFGHLGHEHPTETQKAREYREAASQELTDYQNRSVRIPNTKANRRKRQEEEVEVDEYGNTTHSDEDIMILIPRAVEEEEVEEEEEEFSEVIVDDADDDIVGPRVQKTSVSGQQVYLDSSHHYPGSSHY